MLYYLACLLLHVLIFALWALAQASSLTLAWDAPGEGIASTRIYEYRAGACVLNPAQYQPLIPDVPAPAGEVTLEVEEGGHYCWLARFIAPDGTVGQPSYVLGVVVPTPGHGWTEAALQEHIRALARRRAYKTYHTHDSRGSEPGYPDLTMTNGERLLFWEVKDRTRKVTAEQRVWLELLNRV